MWISIDFCLVILHSSSFVILSVHFIFIILLKHLFINVCNLLVIWLVVFQVSHPYNNTCHWLLTLKITSTLCFMYRALWYKLFNVNQQNVLFELMFWLNSSCLLHVSNILCSSSGDYIVHAALYGTFFTRLCKQPSRLDDVLELLPHLTVQHLN